MKLARFLRTLFLTEHLQWLLLIGVPLSWITEAVEKKVAGRFDFTNTSWKRIKCILESLIELIIKFVNNATLRCGLVRDFGNSKHF